MPDAEAGKLDKETGTPETNIISQTETMDIHKEYLKSQTQKLKNQIPTLGNRNQNYGKPEPGHRKPDTLQKLTRRK
ncbi:hypothetical protein BaRGS_00038906 [Batillaria attramentaria]|uniref:Uncharacterized protein n=1 Tax=Batillaria attramentaria TaxID=370345 RepID=A0ABD0J564_9CAEN